MFKDLYSFLGDYVSASWKPRIDLEAQTAGQTTTEGDTGAPYIITGRKGTGTHPRLEIRDLADKKEQWTLFILALIEIQKPGYHDASTQFVSMAGIHGLPYARWAGDPTGSPDSVKASWKGYCTHASVLFPTWHRACMLLMEQAIGDAAIAIANSFNLTNATEQEKWDQAAEELRFPFWDWTDPRTEIEGLPRLLYQEKVTIYPPTSREPLLVDNPLACYKFGSTLPPGFSDIPEPPGKGGVSANTYFSKWNRTYRWPEKVPKDPKEDYEGLNAMLRKSAAGLRSQVAMLFSFPSDTDSSQYPIIWDEFSNTRFQSQESWPSPFCAGSLESSHNSIHLILGGIGAMSDPDYAGFDPIFFLHHANVDRIYALWEYVYPKYWIGDGYRDNSGQQKHFTQEEGTWGQVNNAILNDDTDLAPFRMSEDRYWDSNHSRSLERESTVPKYYTYPPVAGVHVDRPAINAEREQYLRALQAHFGMHQNSLIYTPRNIERPTFYSALVQMTSAMLRGGFDQSRIFVVAVELVEHAFNRSYGLEVVYNEGSPQEHYVGLVTVFTRREVTACAACRVRRNEQARTRGIIPIPSAVIAQLVGSEGLGCYADDDLLAEALACKLSARLICPGGTVLAKEMDPTEGYEVVFGELQSDTAPRLSIWSSTVVPESYVDGEVEPYGLSGWRKHRTLFLNTWVRSVA
uniref:tyrosinase n=1 Tax=Volvariella volvacea TaxID=36659 RepID=A0A977TEP2_9AGAR|nr:polyphenol oxidase 4 [Volvariella volvacea]